MVLREEGDTERGMDRDRERQRENIGITNKRQQKQHAIKRHSQAHRNRHTEIDRKTGKH